MLAYNVLYCIMCCYMHMLSRCSTLYFVRFFTDNAAITNNRESNHLQKQTSKVPLGSNVLTMLLMAQKTVQQVYPPLYQNQHEIYAWCCAFRCLKRRKILLADVQHTLGHILITEIYCRFMQMMNVGECNGKNIFMSYNSQIL